MRFKNNGQNFGHSTQTATLNTKERPLHNYFPLITKKTQILIRELSRL
jgi:hypothetical protein